MRGDDEPVGGGVGHARAQPILLRPVPLNGVRVEHDQVHARVPCHLRLKVLCCARCLLLGFLSEFGRTEPCHSNFEKFISRFLVSHLQMTFAVAITIVKL